MTNMKRLNIGLKRGLVALGLLLILLGAAYPALAQGERIMFLHHSVGESLIWEGGVREGLTARGYEFYDHGYNEDGLVLADGTWTGTNFDVPDDNTDPDGFAAIFAQPLHEPPDNTFSHLMQYDVIAFKSCYPTSNIGDDAQLREYQSYYLSIRDTIDQYPQKIFIIVTPPPQVPANSDPAEGARARAFANWLQSSEYLAGHPNAFVFDFFDLLAGNDNFLRSEYRIDESDGHPNELANRTIGPLFVDFIDQAIRSYRAGGPPPVIQATPPPPSEMVETPETAVEAPPPIAPAATTLIDDFEAYGPGEGWDTWTDEGETTMECWPDSDMAHNGTSSLLLEYSIAPDGWAGCGWSFDTLQNWSSATGLSMWVHSEEAGQGVAVTMHVGDPEEPTPFEAVTGTPPESTTGWALVELPWRSFLKPDWFGEGGLTQFDPSRVVGISFDFGAPENSRNEGTLWVDDISLSVEAPTAPPAPEAPATALAPIPQAEEGEEDEEGMIGGICPCSSLSLPLAALGFVFWRRNRRD
jgi:hypothetical protein